MTISELIKKLRTEAPELNGKPNGCYAVLQSWINDIEKIKNEYDLKKREFVRTINKLNEIYMELDGFLWGLYATGFISDKEQDEVRKEFSKLTSIEEGKIWTENQ